VYVDLEYMCVRVRGCACLQEHKRILPHLSFRLHCLFLLKHATLYLFADPRCAFVVSRFGS
jgi:hypothetical protein